MHRTGEHRTFAAMHVVHSRLLARKTYERDYPIVMWMIRYLELSSRAIKEWPAG